MRTFSGLLGLAAIAAVSATPAVAADLSTTRQAPAAAAPQASVEVGVLVCNVEPSVGLVIGSVRNLTCELRSSAVQPYGVMGNYKGTISRLGVDIGMTTGGTLAWSVFAPTSNVGTGSLSGNYVGVSANAALNVGGGVNVLVGGSRNSISLQPLSLEGTSGATVAAGVANLRLEPMAAPRYTK
ncbi:DUF992 domain-containing protein [Xanthobacter sp. TB0139]|uniref:DUF992 domain-containing protein n=1 Tax=Xanthobacter sp. TB0139 TaxID=3459178 RepID=UPI00403A6732